MVLEEKQQEEVSPILSIAGTIASTAGWVHVDDGLRGPYYEHLVSREICLERPAVVPGERLLWPDASPLCIYRGRCGRCCSSQEIRQTGPILLSTFEDLDAEVGRLAVSYSLCKPCLLWLAEKAQEGEGRCELDKDEIKGTSVSVASSASLASSLQGKLASPKLFALLKRYSYPKVLHIKLDDRIVREGRRVEQTAAALDAHKLTFAWGEERRRKVKALAMKRRCEEEFDLASGEYVCGCTGDSSYEYYGSVSCSSACREATGIGLAEYPNGNSCFGRMSKGQGHTNKSHPKNKFQWADGRVYEGNMVKGSPHGKGCKSWPDGRIYEGLFVSGLEHGEGTLKWPDGSEYTGRFRFGRRDGPGSFIDEMGRKHKGNYKDEIALDGDQASPLRAQTRLPNSCPVALTSLVEMSLLALARCIDSDSGRSGLPSQRILKSVPLVLQPALANNCAEILSDLSQGLRNSYFRSGVALKDADEINLSNTRPYLTLFDTIQVHYFGSANVSLKRLILKSCGLDATSIRPLAGMDRLEELDVSWNPKVGKDGAEFLLESSSFSSLTSLSLAGCNLGPSGAANLSELLLLAGSAPLKRLDLGFNDLGPKGAQSLSKVLALSTTLEWLGLRMNGLGPAGARALSAGLLRNCGSLKVVEVADNRLGRAATCLLAASMKGSTPQVLQSFGTERSPCR
jgi:hypothetical protein